MKNNRTRIMLMAVFLLVFCAVSVWAKGPANVKNTIHNLSSSAPIIGGFPSQYESDESEICIFCHTPHGGVLTGPLWNRSNPSATSFTHYNSSTLSTYLQGLSATRAINDESLLCMACHDGSISVLHLINPSNTLNRNPRAAFYGYASDDVPIVSLFSGTPGAAIGNLQGSAAQVYGHLEDDHPISFSYSGVLASAEYTGTGAKVGQLRDIGTTVDATTALGWKGEGVRFFGSDYRVECSSCHDPHVDYMTNTKYTPFLIRSNSASNLCLACHDK